MYKTMSMETARKSVAAVRSCSGSEMRPVLASLQSVITPGVNR